MLNAVFFSCGALETLNYKTVKDMEKELGIDSTYTALQYAGNYVDENKLFQGIYSTGKPCLYDENETLEDLVKRTQDFYGKYMKESPVDVYIENLKKCKLVKVKIQILNAECQSQ